MAFCFSRSLQKKLLLQFDLFYAGYGAGSSNHSDVITSTVVANGDPYSQLHVSAKETGDIEISGARSPQENFEDLYSTLAWNASGSSIQAFF